MTKHCVICGAPFAAPPTSKKITCSRECSTKRKIVSHTGVRNRWNSKSCAKRSQVMKSRGFDENAKRGLSVASALPASQRGPGNRSSKTWVLISPEKTVYTVKGLKDWARRNAELFDAVSSDADRERVANNIRSGFSGIVQSMKGRKKHPCLSYKGWKLGGWPE